MIANVSNRSINLATLCDELREAGLMPKQVAQQIFELAYHHRLSISTNKINSLVAEAFR